MSSFLVGGPQDCAADSNNPAPEYEPSNGLYTVNIAFHVIMDSTCTNGAVTDQQIHDQIRVLNEDYLALPGTNGSAGADTQIRFQLATTDPDGNPTTGITRTCNTTWYNDQGEYWNTLSWDPTRYLNFYANSAAGSGGYVPVLPAVDPQLVGTNVDRVVVNALAIGVGGPVASRALGRLGTHEIGHYLGLWHTFKNGCGIATEPDCHTTGDLICDTHPDASESDVCPTGETSCGGFEVPINNYMEYTDDYCMDSFTVEQGMRMRCTLLHYRPGIFTTGTCGNGVLEAGEDCDGSELGGASCADIGCNTGAVSCTSSCTLDTSACGDCGQAAFCGDGTCDPGEDACSCAADCGVPPTFESGLCGDGIDNDCDLDVDCADTDCAGDALCQAPVDCSQFTDRQSCRAEPDCRWRNRLQVCVDR